MAKRKVLDMDKAIKRYNDIMYDICHEFATIGTSFSENTQGWTIRDMVAECDYVLSCYYEEGHVNEEMRRGDAYERKMWVSETGKLRRFINSYLPFIQGVEAVSGHCSQYDR